MDFNDYRFIAHRGLYNRIDIPENSLPAFENAASKGYAIELDVNMTKDGYLVVFHDNNLKRMTGIKNEITSANLNEIRKLKLGGTDYKIPTLEEVLMRVNGRVPLLIEVKQNVRYKEIMPKLIKLLEKYSGPYCIESFDPRIVYWLKKNAPQVSRGQLADVNIREVDGRLLKILLGKMVFNIFTKPDFIAYQYLKINSKFYTKQKRKNRWVAAWTVKSKEEYLKIKDNADMIIFENEETIL